MRNQVYKDISLIEEVGGCLLCNEAFYKSIVLGVIRRLAKDGMTMIIVTHEMEFAQNISIRVFYMDEGIIYEEGIAEQIFENPQKEKTKIFINRV